MFHAIVLTVLALPSGSLGADSRDGVTLSSDLDGDSRDQLFRVTGDARDAAARLLQERFELKARGRVEVDIRAFRLESDYDDHRRATRDRQTQDYGAAFYNPSSREITVAWLDGADESCAALRGQVARQVLLRYAKEPPVWFEEGWVAYFTGLGFDPYGGVISSVDEARLAEARDAVERDAHCPLEDLFELETVDFFGYAGASNHRFATNVLIAESWSLLHHLLDHAGDDDAPFVELLARRLSTGRDRESAVRETLPGLEQRWREGLADPATEMRARLLREAWEDLAAADAAAARMKASQVLGHDEGQVSARRVLAHAALHEQDYDAAVAAFDRLLEQRPDDLDALLGRGTAWLRLAIGEQRDGAAERAIDSGRRAAEVAPAGDRHRGLSLAADAADAAGDLGEALKLVREALRLRDLPSEARDVLRDRERELVRRAAQGGSP